VTNGIVAPLITKLYKRIQRLPFSLSFLPEFGTKDALPLFQRTECSNLIQEETEMGAIGKIAEAGVVTWLFGGGILMFIIVLVLLKAC